MQNLYKKRALDIAQRYLGMTPKDLGCNDWSEMNEKLANEIIEFSETYKKKAIIGHVHVNERDFSRIVKVDELLVPHYVVPDYKLTEKNSIHDLIASDNSNIIKKINKLSKEIKDVDEVGVRGVTNNRKIKKKKKAKNGNKKNK